MSRAGSSSEVCNALELSGDQSKGLAPPGSFESPRCPGAVPRCDGADNVMTPKQLTCKEIVELVTEYLEGRLPRRERKRFESHIAKCPWCTAYLEQMRQVIRDLGSVDGGLDRPPCARRVACRISGLEGDLTSNASLNRRVRHLPACRRPANDVERWLLCVRAHAEREYLPASRRQRVGDQLRWQRHQSASAHMIAERPLAGESPSTRRSASSNSGVAM